MEHGSHLVDLVDEHGAIVGTKRRVAIDKTQDTYHTVFTLLVTPMGGLVLGRIPARIDLPNLYAGQLGVPVATIRRSDETPLAAAQRSLQRELFIDSAAVILVGEEMFYLPEGRQTYASVYYLVADVPQAYSRIDIDELVVLSPHELREQLQRQPQRFTPTFLKIWARFHHQLPL